MKETVTDQLKVIFESARKWLSLEIEYARLTVAEKSTVLLTTLIFGAVGLFLGMVILLLLSLALVSVFAGFLPLWLAYICVSGVILILLALIYLLRRPLLENPISRLVSILILDVKTKSNTPEDEQ